MIAPELMRQRLDICAAMHQSPVVGLYDLHAWVGLPRSKWMLFLRTLDADWKPQGTFFAGNTLHMYTIAALDWLQRLTAEFPEQFGVGEQQP